MPKSSKKKSNNKSDEPVTQFFNFPGAWVKDYDPEIHGFRPDSHFQQPQHVANSLPYQQVPPGQGQHPANAQTPPQNYKAQPERLPLNQWNPNGVYGGLGETKKAAFPWWGWLALVFLALVILFILGNLLGIYPVF